MNHSMTELKTNYRLQLRQQRDHLSKGWVTVASHCICQNIILKAIYQDAQSIALYMPLNQEVDTSALLFDALKAGKRIFLPVINEKRLDFVLFSRQTRLRTKRFGVLEPHDYEQNQVGDLLGMDLLILPVVGYDRQGGRLGYGGGYYDRTLAPLKTSRAATMGRDYSARRDKSLPPVLVGLAFSMQEIPPLSLAPHDVTLDFMATEKGFFRFGRSNPT